MTLRRSGLQSIHDLAGRKVIMLGKHAPLDLSEVCRQSLSMLQASAPKSLAFKADFPSYNIDFILEGRILIKISSFQYMRKKLVISS